MLYAKEVKKNNHKLKCWKLCSQVQIFLSNLQFYHETFMEIIKGKKLFLKIK